MRVSIVLLLCIASASASSILIGKGARNDNQVEDVIALGTNAQAINKNHSLAFSINPASVRAQSLGLTLNGKGYFVPTHSAILAIIHTTGTFLLTGDSAPKHIFKHSHNVVLPAVGTLEPGDEFMLLSLGGDVIVRTSLRASKRRQWRLPAGVGATFMYTGLAGDDDHNWVVHGPWRIQ
jgi:co-chaperonin GroES (HSP10)